MTLRIVILGCDYSIPP